MIENIERSVLFDQLAKKVKNKQNEDFIYELKNNKKIQKLLTEVFEEYEKSNQFIKWYGIRTQSFFDRCTLFSEWLIERLVEPKLWLYIKSINSPTANVCEGNDGYGNTYYGPNFGSADYLGLSVHPIGKAAAIEATKKYGVGYGGNPGELGCHQLQKQFEDQIKEFWGVKAVQIYSTGWLASYGPIRALIKDNDHILLDKLSHNCITEASYNSTGNIHFIRHLDVGMYEEKAKEIREKYPNAGILLITEGLFSMDSDWVDLKRLQQVAKSVGGYLLIDCAHDFGCMGETGKGTFELEGLTDLSNVILTATGSKSVSTNCGFVGSDNVELIEYMKQFCPTYKYCTALSPVQLSCAMETLKIISSEEGRRIRKQLIENVKYTREKFSQLGYTCIGKLSPIIPLLIGNEIVTKFASRMMINEGVTVNGIEFPVCARGQARLRLAFMPTHTKENLDQLIESFDRNVALSEELVKAFIPQQLYTKINFSAKNVVYRFDKPKEYKGRATKL